MNYLFRIKIHIRVQDETGSATFCLFQQDVAKLLGKSVGYLISLIDQVMMHILFYNISYCLFC